MLSTLARFPKFEKGIGIVKPWSPSTERRIGEKLGRSELPGRSKEKSTNSPFRICSSSLFGKLGVTSNGEEDVDGCDERRLATCGGLPRSRGGVGAFCAGKLGSGGG